MIKPHSGDDPNQLISIFLDHDVVQRFDNIIEIDGVVPCRFFRFFFMHSFSRMSGNTEILIAEVFAANNVML